MLMTMLHPTIHVMMQQHVAHNNFSYHACIFIMIYCIEISYYHVEVTYSVTKYIARLLFGHLT